MREIIRKVEDRIFLGTTNSYNVYKEFDIDKDGYISEKDLVNKIDHLNILNKEELPLFLNYVSYICGSEVCIF